MSRSIGFVCAELLPLLLESTEAPFDDAAVQCLHLARAMRRRGWQPVFVTPLGRPVTPCVVASDLGPIHIVEAAARADGPWGRARAAWRLRCALRHLRLDVVVDGRAPDVWSAWLGAPRALHLLPGERIPAGGPHGWRSGLGRDVLVPSRSAASSWQHGRRRAHVLPPAFPTPAPAPGPRDGVVWVGALDAGSGADVLLDLAAAFPDSRFDVLGMAGGERRYAARFRHRAVAHPNVRLSSDVAHRDVVARLAAARLLVSTRWRCDLTAHVVLAWLHGAVVVALQSDPDALLSAARLGLTAADPHALCDALQRGLEDETLCAAIRARARRHAETHFDIEHVAPRFERLVEQLASG